MDQRPSPIRTNIEDVAMSEESPLSSLGPTPSGTPVGVPVGAPVGVPEPQDPGQDPEQEQEQEQEPEQEQEQGQNNLYGAIQQINEQLDSSSDRLLNTFNHYRNVMDMYGEGHEVCIRILSEVSKRVIKMKSEATEMEESLKEKAAEIERITQSENALRAEIERNQSELSMMTQEYNKVRDDSGFAMQQLQNDVSSLQQERSRIQAELDRSVSSNTQQGSAMRTRLERLNRQIRFLQKDRADMTTLLEKTFEKVKSLEQLISNEVEGYTRVKEDSRKRKVQLMSDYRSEFDTASKHMNEIGELTRVYNEMIEKGLPKS